MIPRSRSRSRSRRRSHSRIRSDMLPQEPEPTQMCTAPHPWTVPLPACWRFCRSGMWILSVSPERVATYRHIYTRGFPIPSSSLARPVSPRLIPFRPTTCRASSGYNAADFLALSRFVLFVSSYYVCTVSRLFRPVLRTVSCPVFRPVFRPFPSVTHRSVPLPPLRPVACRHFATSPCPIPLRSAPSPSHHSL